MSDLPHPANTKPASRQWFYILSGLLGTVLPTLSATGVLPPEVGIGGGVVGGAGALTAGAVVSRQRKDGLHDEVDPIEQIQAAAQTILQEQAEANATADRLRSVMSGNVITPQATVLPDFSAAPTPPSQNGSLAQQALDSILAQ